ncbi:MAG: hypothetical protein QOE70_2816 [Chthoniobacter sp.]|jgi:hypothetical protein|nr:hypothetical protein [Chthoniobacter sp.]
MTDEQLSALLRLKRFEQPPPGYYDRLLENVHRRQRAELLRRPLWKIALERTQVFFSEHSMGHLSYAGAMAALLLTGIVAIRVMVPGRLETKTSPVIAKLVVPPPPAPAPNRYVVIENQPHTPALEPKALPMAPPSTGAPRYVIDARPASYEPSSSSFRF